MTKCDFQPVAPRLRHGAFASRCTAHSATCSTTIYIEIHFATIAPRPAESAPPPRKIFRAPFGNLTESFEDFSEPVDLLRRRVVRKYFGQLSETFRNPFREPFGNLSGALSRTTEPKPSDMTVLDPSTAPRMSQRSPPRTQDSN